MKGESRGLAPPSAAVPVPLPRQGRAAIPTGTGTRKKGACPQTVGRRGALSYEFEREGQRTVLRRCSCSSPWHHFPPAYLDDSGCACTWLVNPSGGLVGGDHVTVEAQLHADTHVLMTSPSANRVYRSLSEPAIQEVRLSVGPHARLEWVPELTIPFAGSRFCQSIHVDLAPGATVVLWDAIASGRVARQERWAFASVENEICIRGLGPRGLAPRGLAPPSAAVPVPVEAGVEAEGETEGEAGGQAPPLKAEPVPLLVERYRLVPGRLPESVGLVGSWDYVASLFVVGNEVDVDVWKGLDAALATIMEQRPGLVLGGVSTLEASGMAVKLVARSAPDLNMTLEAIWTAVRKHLWNLPAPNLRRY